MARSLSNTKLISSYIVDQLAIVTRRGFATTASVGNIRGSGVAMMKKGGEESKKSTPWVPDPVTGYYKPEGQVNQVDAIELRELVSKQKAREN